MSKAKTPVRVERFDDLEFAPRFEYGDMAKVSGICGAEDGTELGTGWGRLSHARIPWTIRYDEVLTVFEGVLMLHANGEVHELRARDCIWLPSGTELVYEAESALIHFAIHPSNWHEIE
ncbi:MAG: ethanolamine utilization protein EutQ [Gammaproteobacteria bacterium]|nr:ethanolamine utilization protein EutQ [Gammaproteobacteria bacterium]